MGVRAAGHFVSLGVAALVLTTACSSGPPAPDDSSYLSTIAAARATTNRAFAELPECGSPSSPDECSPVPAAKRTELLPLRYYDVDPGLNVPAALRLSEDRPVFDMPTSTGTLRKMQRVGVLEFRLGGEPMTLAAFVPNGTRRIESLFVPFADLTTGNETYPAGRYLDLDPTATGIYAIDFNRAYNPYCAYNNTYECPYPPPSNRLKVAIRAGEKAPGA
ncbi:MAG TPA: DUF1684 domain-containing protein [Vicinamibacterales bacterium]|nr:DUF1684 domain-containing protein [Vicinamibacterales bacterium]